jgi:uncharacterized protein YhaN
LSRAFPENDESIVRLSRLELIRYGRFTDVVVDLPRSQPDLHLVVGPNEAGKSTARAALSDLLFGIASSSPYAFVHDYKTMLIGGVIERGEDALAVRRRKGVKNTLLGPYEGDKPVDETMFAKVVGYADRTFFERMWSLDHAGLVDGGRQLLDAKDDLGRMLFQTSGGLAHFGQVRDDLEQQADDLWGARRSDKRAYYRALDRLREAERDRKAHVVRVRDYREKEQRVTECEDALREADLESRTLADVRARLERIKRAGPALDRRRHWTDELRGLGEAPVLPEGASREVHDAMTDIALAESDIDRLADERTKIASARDAATMDDAVLARAADIREASERRYELRKHGDDIAKRRAEVELLRSQVVGLSERLGWSGVPLAVVEERLASDVAERELLLLVERHAKLVAAVEVTASSVRDKRDERDACASERDPSRDRGTPPLLREALVQARKLGDVVARRRALSTPFDAAVKRAQVAFDKLAPWTGSLDALRTLVPPTTEEIEPVARRLEDLAEERRQTERDRTTETETLANLRLEMLRAKRDAELVTADEVIVARERRNARWSMLRPWIEGDASEGSRPRESEVREYEAMVRESDVLADRRLDGAEASVRANKLGLEEELSGKRLDRIAARIDALAGQWVEASSELVRLQEGLGVSFETPAKLRAWMDRRARALESGSEAERLRNELDDHDRDVEAAICALKDALARSGADVSDVDGRSLAGLVAVADWWTSALDDARGHQQALAERLAILERTLPGLEEKHALAAGLLTDWRVAFAARAVAIGLPASVEPETAVSALSIMRDLRAKLGEIAVLEKARIAAMERDLISFAAAVDELASECGPGLARRPSFDVVRELESRLAIAEEAKRTRAAADDAIVRIGVADRAARVRKAQAVARLQPLLDAAGVEERGALLGALERSDRRRRVQRELDAAEQTLLEIGDGMTIEALEAEAAAEDRALLDDAIGKANASLDALAARQRERTVSLHEAQRALDAVCGQADGATDESRCCEAVAAMVDTMERYVHVRTASVLLRWAIDRFRREKQGPLLSRASVLFSRLTLGEFLRLDVDYDETDRPRLEAVRQGRDSKKVPVEGLSTGTADQLFLALRLAAVEAHMDRATAMPFVADDLLVQFDDRRAGAALAVIGEFAQRTQVLFFTHHEHLVHIAQDAIGPDLHVVRL